MAEISDLKQERVKRAFLEISGSGQRLGLTNSEMVVVTAQALGLLIGCQPIEAHEACREIAVRAIDNTLAQYLARRVQV